MMVYFKGFLLGMTLQLSVGPVFFALLHKSIKEGFVEGFKMTLGVAIVDAAYIALSFTAVSRILAVSGNLAWILRVVGALVLCYFGFGYSVRSLKTSEELTECFLFFGLVAYLLVLYY